MTHAVPPQQEPRVSAVTTGDIPWWKSAVIYQIYPRSFLDTDGDGIGDLRGITEKIPYLKSLGIDAIWLGPICSSPNDDMGYDVSDYREIMSEFGSMRDFDELMGVAKSAGLRVIVDLVLNHTSDEHVWFVDAKSSRDSEYRDFYIWRDGKGNEEPSNWESVFSGSTWEFDEASGQYYLHLYSKKQPDLNWDNPKVRDELYDIVQFWIDKGVDGFRLDTITTISKPEDFPNAAVKNPGERYQPATEHYINGPRMVEHLTEFHRRLLKGTPLVTIGEAPGATPSQALSLIDREDGVMDMLIQWEHIEDDPGTGGKWGPETWTVAHFRSVMSAWQHGMFDRGWNALYLNNHDQPRAISRFADDKAFHRESATMLATCIHMLQGTPFVYQGEEIGMTNVAFPTIEEYRCVETRNMYRKATAEGQHHAVLMDRIHKKSRDNGRTPMQWTAAPNAGFTSGNPWIGINPNHDRINVAAQESEPQSVLNYYRRLIGLRKANSILVQGSYEDVEIDNPWIYAYRRHLNGETWLVLNNFADTEVVLPSNLRPQVPEVVICNYTDDADDVLRPYESRVYRWFA